VSAPLVTVGVPVYRGQDDLPVTLACLRDQTYQNMDVLISVDGGDQSSAAACEPFLHSDPRFRLCVQPTRLGWAGNTDWTMRQRRGAFYIFQQHDDQVSPDYVASLVEAAIRNPDAAILFAEIEFSGLRSMVQRGSEILGSPVERALSYLHSMDYVPLRGLMRGSALETTSGLLLSDFDPFDSFGTEFRLMAQLALAGEFRFVPGPTYYKRMHGSNLHLKRENWSDHHKQRAWACLSAWMVEAIAPAGRDAEQCRELFHAVLDRFVVARDDRWKWLRAGTRRITWSRSRVLQPARLLLDRLRSSERLAKGASNRWMLYEARDRQDRAALLRLIFDRLKAAGRLDPSACLQSSWQVLEAEALRRFLS
jgi:GT2 family glycosyltransferase